MKVHVLINGTTKPGMYGEARKAVVATVAYLNQSDKYVGTYTAVRRNDGPNNHVIWLCQYESFADYEKDSNLRPEDPEWAKVFEGVNQSVDVDTVTSEILRTMT